MRQRRRTEQDKRRTYPSRIWWQITWSWKSQELSIHQRAWLGVRERDSRQEDSRLGPVPREGLVEQSERGPTSSRISGSSSSVAAPAVG